MVLLARFIGLVVAVIGMINLVNPDVMKKALAFFRQGKRIYAAGAARILIGVLFLAAASQSNAPAIMLGLGVLVIVSGAAMFAIGFEKCKKFIGALEEKPASVRRAMAAMALIIGILILYSA